MAQTRTPQSVIDEARLLADNQDTDYLTDDNLFVFFQRHYKNLYDIIRSNDQGESYFLKTADLTGTLPDLDLPSDFLDLKAVYMTSSSNTTRNDKLVKLPLDLYPHVEGLSSAAETFTIRYIPTPDVPATLATSFNTYNGFDEYILMSIVIDLLGSEEQDVRLWQQERGAALQRIISMAPRRGASPKWRAGWRYYRTSQQFPRVQNSGRQTSTYFYELTDGDKLTLYQFRRGW